MSELPNGTVTLLFTDIEGSTRLLQHLGGRYHNLLAEHRRLLRLPSPSIADVKSAPKATGSLSPLPRPAMP
jgi:hypothetical protein